MDAIRHSSLRQAAIACVMFMAVTSAEAGGFYAPQQGAIGVGLGNAGGSVRASDGSTVFFNPAGMVHLPGGAVQGGISVISPTVNIDDRGSTAITPGGLGAAVAYPGRDARNRGDPVPLPSVYLAYPIRPDLWAGFGVTAPFGLDLEYRDDWFGRYDSIKNQLVTVNLGPALAYRVNDVVAVGGGIDLQYADAELVSALPDPLAPGGPSAVTDGRSKLTGDDWSLGFNIGVTLQISPVTRIGLHYRSAIDHTLKGDVRISDFGGPLEVLNGKTSSKAGLDLPPILSAGVAHDFTRKLRVFGEAQWFGWSTFEDLRIRFSNGAPDRVLRQDFDDTLAVSTGARYVLNDRWTLRGGVQYDQTPTVDRFRNTSIPDGDLVFLGVGASYRVHDRMFLDLGLNHVFFSREDIDLNRTFFEGSPLESQVDIRGRTDNDVNTLSFNLRYHLD